MLRNPLCRAVIGLLIVLLMLSVGSQIAHDRGQSVEWYSGFGSWLGAVGSIIAAGVALWIALSGRLIESRRREADLDREAGLVKVVALDDMLRNPQFNGYGRSDVGFKVVNRRTDRIFDLEVAEYRNSGKSIKDHCIGALQYGISGVQVADKDALREIALPSDESVLVQQNPKYPAVRSDYIAIDYTDSRGRRWRVDTVAKVKRLP